jgi:gliding motility-associated-like protein
VETLTLLRIDKNGKHVWSKNYSLNGECAYGGGMTLTRDSGYVVASLITNYNSPSGIPNGDMLLFKTDSAGNLKWVKTYGSKIANEYSNAVVEAKGSVIYAAGSYNPHASSIYHFNLIKIDSLGNRIWDNSYGNDTLGYCYPNGILMSKNKTNVYLYGDYYEDVSNSFLSYRGGLELLKVNPNGNAIFNTRYSAVDTNFQISTANSQMSNSGNAMYTTFLSSYYSMNTYFNDFGILKTDTNGVVLKCVRLSLPDSVHSLSPSAFVIDRYNQLHVFFMGYLDSTYTYYNFVTTLDSNLNYIKTSQYPSNSIYLNFLLASGNKITGAGYSFLLSAGLAIAKFLPHEDIACLPPQPKNFTIENFPIITSTDNGVMAVFGDSTGLVIVSPANLSDSVICTQYIVYPPGSSNTIEEQFFIPNIFTPNNDGVNDLFLTKFEGFYEVHFDIYNRWGQKLFTSSDNTTFWNGNDYQNQMCPDGTYYYVFTGKYLSSGNERKEKGFLTLLRN